MKLELNLDLTKFQEKLAKGIHDLLEDQYFIGDLVGDVGLDKAIRKKLNAVVSAAVLEKMKDPKFVAKLAAERISGV